MPSHYRCPAKLSPPPRSPPPKLGLGHGDFKTAYSDAASPSPNVTRMTGPRQANLVLLDGEIQLPPSLTCSWSCWDTNDEPITTNEWWKPKRSNFAAPWLHVTRVCVPHWPAVCATRRKSLCHPEQPTASSALVASDGTTP